MKKMKKIKKPGIYELTNEEYHEQDALNKSGLVQLSKSPSHFHEWYNAANDEPTNAMQIGTALHTAILEPAKYDESIIVAPQVDKRTKKGKAEWAAFQEKSKGKTILTQEEVNTIDGMRNSVYKTATAYDYLMEGIPEQSVFFKDPVHKFLCKVRLDWYTGLKEVVDLKSCVDASYEAFSRTIANYLYHWQAFFYLKGISAVKEVEHTKFIFIAVEKDPPYGVSVYEATEAMLKKAQTQIEPLLNVYAHCLKTDVWPGYKDELQQIDLPRWAA